MVPHAQVFAHDRVHRRQADAAGRAVRAKGFKGAVGTSASYSALLDGTGMSPAEMEELYAKIASRFTVEDDAEVAIERALACEAAGRAEPRISNSEGAAFNAGLGLSVYGNSDGFIGRSSGTSYSQSCVLLAGRGDGMQRDYSYDSRRCLADLEPVEATGADASFAAVPPKFAPGAIIEAAEAGASIIHLHARDPVTGKPDPRPETMRKPPTTAPRIAATTSTMRQPWRPTTAPMAARYLTSPQPMPSTPRHRR